MRSPQPKRQSDKTEAGEQRIPFSLPSTQSVQDNTAMDHHQLSQPMADPKLQLKRAQTHGFSFANIALQPPVLQTTRDQPPIERPPIERPPIEQHAGQPSDSAPTDRVIQAAFISRDDLIRLAGPPNKGAFTRGERNDLSNNAGNVFNWSTLDPVWRTSKKYVQVLNALDHYTHLIGETSGATGMRTFSLRKYLGNPEVQAEIDDALFALMEVCQKYIQKHGSTGKRSTHIVRVWNEARAERQLLEQVKASPMLVQSLPNDFDMNDLRNKGLDFQIQPSHWIDTISHGGPENTPSSLDSMTNRGVAKAGGQGRTIPYSVPGRDGESPPLKLLGKVDRREGPKGEVAYEYGIYKQIYERVGQHPNLAKVHGWAELQIGHDSRAEGMLLEQIPGKDGMEVQMLLQDAWDDGIINSSQYFGAHQFITSRLLDVIEHLNRAGFVHNDIKPENYVVDQTTGEPIVIDLGGAALIGAAPRVGTKEYMNPTLYQQSLVRDGGAQGTPKSDLFTVGSTVAHGIEAPHHGHKQAKPNQGLMPSAKAFTHVLNAQEQVVPQHNAFEYGADTDYTKFISLMIDGPEDESDGKSPLERAREHPFIRDRALENADARDVLRGIVSGQWRQVWEQRWLESGKEMPQREQRTTQAQLAGKVKNMIKTLDVQNDQAQRLGVTDSHRAVLEKAKTLMKHARFRQIDSTLLDTFERYLQELNGLVNAADPSNPSPEQTADA